MRCFGFSFTMPAGFVAPPTPLKPPDVLFGLFPQGDNDYFRKGHVTFEQGATNSENGECVYNPFLCSNSRSRAWPRAPGYAHLDA